MSKVFDGSKVDQQYEEPVTAPPLFSTTTIEFQSQAVEPDDSGLSPFALTALLVVGITLLIGIPSLYLITSYLPKKKDDSLIVLPPPADYRVRKTPNAAPQEIIVENPMLVDIEASLPPNNDFRSWIKAEEMRKLRAEALQAAQLPTDFAEPYTKIARLNIARYLDFKDYDWLVKGVEKCEKWDIEMDEDQLSITSKRTIEETLEPNNFKLAEWKQRMTGRDWRKTILARPPPVMKNLGHRSTEDDIMKMKQLKEELQAIEEKQKKEKNKANTKKSLASKPRRSSVRWKE